jgi:uncharacterized repeat protein (TIGR01451 family)
MIHRNSQKIKVTRIIILAVALLTFCFIASGTNVQMQSTVPSNCGLLNGCEVVYNSFSCTPDNCSGFEGIFSCCEEGASVAGGGPRAGPSRKGGPDIRVTKTYNTSDDKNISYSINVYNDGGTDLEDVKLVDILPKGLDYQGGATLSFDRLNSKEPENKGLTNPVEITPVPKLPPNHKYTNLTWILGKLRVTEQARINMNVIKSESTIDPSANKAFVQGNWTNETVKDIAMKAETVLQSD